MGAGLLGAFAIYVAKLLILGVISLVDPAVSQGQGLVAELETSAQLDEVISEILQVNGVAKALPRPRLGWWELELTLRRDADIVECTQGIGHVAGVRDVRKRK